jgi:hypothetical protein
MAFADPERRKEYEAAYYQKNKAKIMERSARHRAASPEHYREYHRRYNNRPDVVEKRRIHSKRYESMPSKAIMKYKRMAVSREIEWALPEALAIDLITDNCFYCGGAPSPLNGIDRVDNVKGYLEDNVVTACKHCNTAKMTRSRSDFESWAIRVAQHVGAGKFYPFA